MSLIEAITSPKTMEVDMTASQADKLLTVCRGDREAIKKVLIAYDYERERLEKYCASPELLGRPLYQWKPHFSFEKMLRIAENIALGLGYSPSEDEDMLDQEWGFYCNDIGDMKFPEIKFNAFSKKPKDVKMMIEAAFIAKKFYTSIIAHIARVRPVEHGGLLKVAAQNMNPLIGTRPNQIEINDLHYIQEFIQRDKMLYYCNRKRFLKILRLKPIDFGFRTSRWDETTTYREAKDRYFNWWETKLEREIQNWCSGDSKNHPLIKFYLYIKNFLNLNCKETIDKGSGDVVKSVDFNVNFNDFFNNLFSYVLDKLDEDKLKHEQSRERLRRVERNLTGQSWAEIDSMLEKDGTVSLNREQLESILHQRASAVAANIAAQNRKLDEQQRLLMKIIGNPPKTNQDKNEEMISKTCSLLLS